MDDPREGFDDHDPDLQEAARQGFAEYGIDNVGRQGPGQADDPHVEVEPVLDAVRDNNASLVDWLDDPAFQADLLRAIGPVDLERDDFGLGRYLECCRVIAGVISDHF